MAEEKFRVDFQVHLHESNYGLDDVFDRMASVGLSGIGALSYPHQEAIPTEFLRAGSKSGKYTVEEGRRIIVGENKENGNHLYLFLGQEMESSDRWHLLVIGNEVEYDLANKAPLRDYIDEGLDKSAVVVFDHPFADVERGFADLRKPKEIALTQIVREYGDKIGFEWNGYCHPLLRWATGKVFSGEYGDVNRKLQILAARESLRIVPTSDTHARSKWLLNGMGAAYAEFSEADLNFGIEEAVCSSMQRAIMKGDYSGHKGYVSHAHFFWAFGWPRIKEKIFNR